MKIVVAHIAITALGGAEQLNVNVVKTLLNLGYEDSIATLY